MTAMNRKICLTIAIIAVTGLITNCSDSGGGASGSAGFSVSGVLGLSNNSSSNVEDFVSSKSVTLTDYKVSCATTTSPILSGTSDIGTDGSFKVTVTGAENKPMACFLVDATDTKVADFIISDSSKKDLNGNSESSSSATYKSAASLGSIQFDPNAGEVTVPAANVAASVSTAKPRASAVFDPTGSWTIGAIDFTPPKGAMGPCDPSDNECKGPPSGQAVYFKLWKGVVTADASDVFGLQLWQDVSKFTGCGSKIGLTPAIKTALGVDFSANVGADSVFSFANTVTFTDQILSASSSPTLTGTAAGKWKMSTARAQHDLMPSCGPSDVTSTTTTYSNAWVCGPDNSGDYQAQLGGGCVIVSTNKPVDVRDWSQINSCSTNTNTAGVKSNTCTGTTMIDGNSVAVSCSNKWASVISSGSSFSVVDTDTFNWSELTKTNSGTLCSAMPSGTEAQKIAQLQCYAEYYQRSGIRDASACLPKVDMDWSATASADFEKVDEIRPEGLIFFEKYNALPDGSGGSMTTRQEHYEGVQVGNSWTNCRVVETGGLAIKKISDTKLLATYQASLITTSITKPACLGKFNGTRETFMFYLNK